MRKLQLLMFAGLRRARRLLSSVGQASAQVVEGEEHCVVNVKSSDVLNVRAKRQCRQQGGDHPPAMAIAA